MERRIRTYIIPIVRTARSSSNVRINTRPKDDHYSHKQKRFSQRYVFSLLSAYFYSFFFNSFLIKH